MQILGQAWLVLQLTGSSADLGTLTAVQFLPLLVLSPYAGLLIERLDKRRLLVVTQSVGLVLATTLGVLSTTSSLRLWMIFALAVALGMVSAIEGPARQVFAFELVGGELITNAVSLNEVVINASRVFGPALGGVVISQVGIAACFFINAASYLPAIVAVLLIRQVAGPVLPPGRLTPRGLWEGLRYAAGHRVIRALLLGAAGSAMFFNFGVVLPVFASRVLHLGADGYGLMVAAFGVGAIGGSVLAAADQAPTTKRVRRLAVGAAALEIVCAVMPNLPLELAAQAAVGCVSIWFVALANALLQLRTEPAFRGRVMGLWTMALPGSSPVGGLIVGAVDGALGGRAGLATVGVILLATAVAGWSALADATPKRS